MLIFDLYVRDQCIFGFRTILVVLVVLFIYVNPYARFISRSMDWVTYLCMSWFDVIFGHLILCLEYFPFESKVMFGNHLLFCFRNPMHVYALDRM